MLQGLSLYITVPLREYCYRLIFIKGNFWWKSCLPPSVAPFSCPQSFLASGSFSSESALRIRWPEYWSFSFSPSNEYPGLISFRIDWFDLLAVKGTLKSLLHHDSSKQFFGAQPSLWSNYHICTWLLEKTIVLTIQTFVSKVISLLFNTLSRLVIAFLSRHVVDLQYTVMW